MRRIGSIVLFVLVGCACAHAQTATAGISGVRAFAPSVVWAWGIQRGDFFLIRSEDAGSTWRRCELPPEAQSHADISPSEAAAGEEPEYATFSVPAMDANSVRLVWVKQGAGRGAYLAVGMESAETRDTCQHWTTYGGATSASSDDEIVGDHIELQWLPDFKRGWALMTGDCCGSGQQLTALLRTEDSGHTWQMLRGSNPHLFVKVDRGGFFCESETYMG
jgi:hypothetical protein